MGQALSVFWVKRWGWEEHQPPAPFNYTPSLHHTAANRNNVVKPFVGLGYITVVMVIRRHCRRVFKLNVKPSVTLPLTLQYLNGFQ